MSPGQLNVGGSVININIYYFLGDYQTGTAGVLILTSLLPPAQMGGVCLGEQESTLILNLRNVLIANITIILTQRLMNLRM